MKIIIDTTGTANTTKISINGEEKNLESFDLSVKAGRNLKLHMVENIGKKLYPISFYGTDFKTYDETNPPK